MRSRRVACGVLAVAALAGCSDDGDGERVRGYDVTVDVRDDGSLDVTETVDYAFGDSERHGIVRDVPRRLPHAQEQDRITDVTDVTVQSPTGAPVDLETETDGGSLVLRVGDEDREVTGDHTYVLSYRVDAVATASDGGAQVAWDAVGTGWEVPVDEVTVRLTAPGDLTAGTCVAGPTGSRDACESDTRGDTLTASAGGLDEGEGVTVTATMPAGSVATEPVLRGSFSPARAFGTGAVPLGTALLVLAGLLGAILARLRRGAVPRTPPTDAGRLPSAALPDPPAHARPAQLGTLLDGRADLHEVAATLFDLAGRGLLTLREADVDADGAPKERAPGAAPTDWHVERTGGDRPADLRRYEVELLRVLFADGDRRLLSTLHTKRAAEVAQVQAEMHRDVVELGWFTADPAGVRRSGYAVASALLLGGAALTAALAVWTTFALTGAAVVLAGLVLLGLAHRLPVRTATGAHLLAETRRYRDALAAADPDSAVVERHLAYAVALQVVDEWKGALESSDVVLPGWYAGAPGSPAMWPAVFSMSSSAGTPAPAGGAGGVGVGAGGGGGGSW